jgi:hypothetical protein
MRPLIVACALAGVLFAQQFKFNLDHLAGRASDTVDLSLNSNLLQLGAAFLDTKDPDEAKVKKLIVGLEGIYIKHFEFKTKGQYSPADVDQIRNQLKAPEWERMVGVKSAEDGENLEVWVRSQSGKVNGVAIIATDPNSLTVANIVGNVALDSLAELGRHFDLPKMEMTKKKKTTK